MQAEQQQQKPRTQSVISRLPSSGCSTRGSWSRHSLSNRMTVAARNDLSPTLSQIMDSMMSGVKKTGVLLHVVPICRYLAAAILQALAFRRIKVQQICRNSEDNGNADFERREAWSRTVTAMQFAAYRLHERVLEPNNFLRWGYLFQLDPALSK